MAHYGVSRESGDGCMAYLAGMAVSAATEPPHGLTLRAMPAQRCAVFRCPQSGIHDAFDFLFHEWLPESGYQNSAEACER